MRYALPGLTLMVTAPEDFLDVVNQVATVVRTVEPTRPLPIEIAITVVDHVGMTSASGATPVRDEADPSALAHAGWRGRWTGEAPHREFLLEWGRGDAAFSHAYRASSHEIVVTTAPLDRVRQLSSFRVILYELLTFTSSLRVIHASAVRLARNGPVSLFAGQSGAGKSSFAFAAGRRGGALLAGDLALLTKDGHVLPLPPEPLKVGLGTLVHFATTRPHREGPSLQVLRTLRALPDDLTYELAIPEWWDHGGHGPASLGSIFFVGIDSDGEDTIVPLSPAQALAQLEAVILPFTVREPAYTAWFDGPRRIEFWANQIQNGVEVSSANASLEVASFVERLASRP